MLVVIVFATSMFWAVSAYVMASVSLTQFHEANAAYNANNIAEIGLAVLNYSREQPLSLYNHGYAYPGEGTDFEIDTNQVPWRYLHFREVGNDLYKHAQGAFESDTSTAGMVDRIEEHRLAIWMQSPLHGERKDEDYLKENPCDTGDKGIDAPRWCGGYNSLWLNVESQASVLTQLETEQQRLKRMSRKFLRFYASERNFAVLGPVATSEPLVWYTTEPGTTAKSCKGTLRTQAEPPIYLNCNELFNAWEEPIYLHIVSGNRAVLTNVLGLRRVNPVDGASHVRIAEDMHVLNNPPG